MIRPGAGNLLEADADALVNTVNCAGVMGKGITLQFPKAWPAMFGMHTGKLLGCVGPIGPRTHLPSHADFVVSGEEVLFVCDVATLAPI